MAKCTLYYSQQKCPSMYCMYNVLLSLSGCHDDQQAFCRTPQRALYQFYSGNIYKPTTTTKNLQNLEFF